MAPNSPTNLRKSINPPQTPSPRCTTPTRNKVDDEEDVHRSAPLATSIQWLLLKQFHTRQSLFVVVAVYTHLGK
jgi:hypothetical protein